MIAGNVEERIVTEDEVEHHPRRGGCEHDRAEHGRVQIAHDLFEREEHRGDRSVECGGERGGSADGNQGSDLQSAQSESPRDDGCESGPHVDRGSLTSEWDSAGERNGAADELAHHGSERDAAVVNEERGARLWNAAPAREREVLEEEISGDERAERGDEDAPPTGSAGRIHERREAPGEKNERDDDEADERADDQAEQEGEAVLLAAEVLDQPAQSRRQSSDSYGWHFLKLNASTLLSKRLAHARLSRVGEEAMASSPSSRLRLHQCCARSARRKCHRWT